MPSTYTSNLRTEQMATGENRSTWGTKANKVFQLLENAVTKQITVAMSDANKTLTALDGADDESRSAGITFTGAITANRTVTIPAVDKIYYMKNSTTGGFSLVISNGTSTTTLLNGATVLIFNDGTTIVQSIDLIAGTSGAKVPLLNGANTWSAAQTFTASATTLTYANDAAGAGPALNFGRTSASPAANDALGYLNFSGNNDAAETINYARILSYCVDPADGAEDGRMYIQAMLAGTLSTAAYFQAGLVIGTAAGADKGAGSINAVKVYQNNVPLGSLAFDNSVNIADTSGTLAVARGGTGATDAATARSNLGANNAANLNTGTLPDARLAGTYTGININTTGTITAASLTTTGTTTTDSYLVSSDTTLVMATNGAGIIYLRPVSSGSGTGQMTVASDGDVTIAGDLTVSGGDISGNASSATTATTATTATNCSRSITAGNGLSGGGALTANRSLAVGQGTGITVSSTTVSVDATVWRDGNIPSQAQLAAAGAAGFYTGGSSSATDLPIGSYVVTRSSDSTIWDAAVNAVVVPRLAVGDTSVYVSGGSGTALAGTWRKRGNTSSGSDGHGAMMQRVS